MRQQDGIPHATLWNVIQANCRAQFTADDFSFVVRVLAKSPRDAVSLVSLLSDLEERDAILDHDLIYNSVVNAVGARRFPAAFCYTSDPAGLRRVSLDERALTDYVAAVLLAFTNINQLNAPEDKTSTVQNFTYVSDILTRLNSCSPEQGYVLRLHLSNYTLFLSGMFVERVNSHAERRGAPGISFYEAVGAVFAAQRSNIRRRNGRISRPFLKCSAVNFGVFVLRSTT